MAFDPAAPLAPLCLGCAPPAQGMAAKQAHPPPPASLALPPCPLSPSVTHACWQEVDLQRGELCGVMEARNVPGARNPIVTFWTGHIVDNVNHK